MKAIVAVDQNWGIGKDGCLLTYLPGDLKYFKKMTMGKVVVMGRATFDSLPGRKPLDGRINIVLSRNPEFHADCKVCRSLEELYAELENYDPDEIFIIGGASVYEAMMDWCDEIMVTKIQHVCAADCHFPNLDANEEWELANIGETQCEGDNSYCFTMYRRR